MVADRRLLLRARVERLLAALDADGADALDDRFELSGEHVLTRYAGRWVTRSTVVRMTVEDARSIGADIIEPDASSVVDGRASHVLVRTPAPDGARVIGRMTCAELAALVRRDADQLVTDTAEEIERAVEFYLEPHIRPRVLDGVRGQLVTDAWAFASSRASRCAAAAVLEVLRVHARPERVRGMGIGAAGYSSGGTAHAGVVQAWHRAVARAPDPGAVGMVTWPIDEPRPHVTDDRWFDPVGGESLVELFRARRDALDAMRQGSIPAGYGLAMLRELAADTPWSLAMRLAGARQLAGEERGDGRDAERVKRIARAIRDEADAIAADQPDTSAAALGLVLARLNRNERGQKLAAQLNDRPVEAWTHEAPWAGAVVALALGDAAWKSIEAEWERNHAKPTALVITQHVHITEMTRHGIPLAVDRRGQHSMRYEDRAPVIVLHPTIYADQHDLARKVERGGQRIASYLGHRVLQWQLTTGHAQWQRARDGLFHRNPSVIEFEGGWQTLARHLGNTCRAAGVEVEQIIRAQAFSEWTFANGKCGNMIVLTVTPRRRNQAASIEIQLGRMLMPEFVHNELCGKDRRLVPYLALPPKVGGDRSQWGGQATLAMRIVTALRDGARQLVEDDGVIIEDATMNDLADRSSVRRDTLAGVLDRWTQDGDDAPAHFIRRGRRYTLGDRFAAELEFLRAAGRIELGASKGGTTAADNRRKRLSARRK